MIMTIAQVRYVTEVASTGSINQAAKNLFISQSVLSTSIKNLEKELGKQIFSRSSKGITVTPFGNNFLSYVTPINVQLQQLNNMIKDSGAHSISFSIASNGFHFISNVFSQLYSKYKSAGIRLKQYDVDENETAQYVSNQIADIGLIRFWSCYRGAVLKQLNSLKLQFFPLATLNVGITVGIGSPLFNHSSDYISAAALKPYPIITYNHMDEGPYSDIFERLGLSSSNSRFVTSSRAALYEMVSCTDAYYLNSFYDEKTRNDTLTQSYRPQLRSLMLADCDIQSNIGWIKLDRHNPSQVANEAVNMIAEILEKSSIEKI